MSCSDEVLTCERGIVKALNVVASLGSVPVPATATATVALSHHRTHRTIAPIAPIAPSHTLSNHCAIAASHHHIIIVIIASPPSQHHRRHRGIAITTVTARATFCRESFFVVCFILEFVVTFGALGARGPLPPPHPTEQPSQPNLRCQAHSHTARHREESTARMRGPTDNSTPLVEPQFS